jgi:hypothetical protein
MPRRFGLAVILVTAAGVALAASAQAATVIGQTGAPTACSGGGYGGQVQLSTPAGLSYTVPFDGTITSWSAATDTSGLQTKLLILQPVSGTTFHVVAKSEFSTFTSTGVQTFPAQIPVQAGQVIGDFGQLCYIVTGNASNVLGSFGGPEPAIGTDQSFPGGPPGNAGDLSATVEPIASTPTASTPTGQRDAAIKKCKKKHKKNHNKKQFKKCKKKAKKLPV